MRKNRQTLRVLLLRCSFGPLLLAPILAPAAARLPPPATVQADAGAGRVLQVGPQRLLHTIAAAAREARDGDTVLIDAGDYPADVAVWTQDRLTLRGLGVVRLVAMGLHAEGKGTWVIRGGQVTVDNIRFTGARVPDHNGAGIRFEKGRLRVVNCLFEDNENGLLTAGGDGELTIENSEFFNNGSGDGHTHELYVGEIKKLTVTGSYFHHTNVGHLLKSRAAENHISYNRLTDELGGRASYELEFPNGGLNYVIGNIIEQSASTDNSTIISVGGEGYKWPRNELYLVNNTIADDLPDNGIYLKVNPGLGVLKAVNNMLVGNGHSETGTKEAFGQQPATGWRDMLKPVKQMVKHLMGREDAAPVHSGLAGQFENNVNADWDQFVLAVRYDYRIAPDARRMGYVDPGSANGISLAPVAQYVHPHSSRALSAPPGLPGALQKEP